MFDPTEITDPPSPAIGQRERMIPESQRLVTGVFEPPSGFALSAIARHKLIVLLSILALAVIGVAFGRSRPISYTASATLQIGQVNPNSPGFYGYVQSSAALATAFSRSIAAEPVLATVQDKLKLTPAKALSRLSAEPIPQAPAFRVIATGGSEHGAVALANVAAKAVIAYEAQSNNANPEAESLLHEYSAASVRLQHSNENIAHLVHRSHGHVSKSALARAEAVKNAESARFKAIGSSYNAAVLSQAPRSGLVSLLAGATTASSNRSSKMELFGFLGLLAGIIAGCGFAVLRERVRTRRQPAVGGELSRSQPA
jgi:capsular polysaccharide biosynthesis protein